MYEKCEQNSCEHPACIILFSRFTHKAFQPQRSSPKTSLKILRHFNKVKNFLNGKIKSEIKLVAYFHLKCLVFETKGHKTGETKRTSYVYFFKNDQQKYNYN